MIRARTPLVAALLATATIVTAQARPWGGREGGPGMPGAHAALMGELFPPELVMRHQQEIGLTDDQKSRLVQAMQDLQTDLVPLQFDMGDATARLREALAQPRIDEQKAGDLADRLMSLETKIKRRHLTTMIRMKNVLTPDQQDRLRALREQEPRHGRRGDRPGPPDGGPGAPPDAGDGDPDSGI
ncbi:MAG TPA: periplasmic heavy metal sensor [Candidatus Polarisedimenticolia bacterium]|nr:periplasmic heavy metal sensor [Candidatus Polarisedimenticolia bacterium]